MTVPQRKSEYHHGNLRSALISTATELARDNGPTAVTLRESARRIGVSPSAAYRHFEDQAALLTAVADGALLELAGRMRNAVAAAPRMEDPAAWALARFRAVGVAYVQFALSSPGLFRTAYASGIAVDDSEQPASDRSVSRRLDDHPLRVLAEALDALTEAGLLGPDQRRHAEVTAWSGVHGLAMLVLDGALRDAVDNPQPLVDATLDMIGLGLCAPALLASGVDAERFFSGHVEKAGTAPTSG